MAVRATTILVILSALAAAPAHAQDGVPAFPSAEGAGQFAKGGRGGAVLHVTNLKDSGPGSLRHAVEAEGPRTVVFSVSGTIPLRAPLVVSEPRITIAGQTAPGDGVTLRDQPLIVAADDVVIRYLRSRLGDESGVQEDAIWVRGGRRIILDHISTSWSVDETLSVSDRYTDERSGPFDVTVQWSIIAESLNASGHDKGSHGFGTLTRGGRGSQFSFHHNLWASHLARMPRPGNYAHRNEDPLGAFFDFRNNVFYNWGAQASGYNADTESLSTYNFIANDYQPGPDTKGEVMFDERNPHARSYFSDNTINGRALADPWSLIRGVSSDARLREPYPMPVVTTQNALEARADVLDRAGASLRRDAVDERIVAGVRAGTHAIINSQSDVGGWPQLASHAPPQDTDRDGIPDAWENAHGLDAHDPSDGAASTTGQGYTNLEVYLNALAH